MELYAIIHFLPYLFNCIPYKSIVDHVCQVWLEKSAQLLSLESFFFGSVPLTEGQEVWDRLGSHIYSSVHAYDRCRRTCSEPFIKDENFKLNVYLFIITSVFALSLVTTIILTIFAATGFYFIAIFFHEANDSFHVSILYGFFIFLLTYTLVCAAVHFIHSFCPIRFPDFLLMVYRILTRLFVYIFIIPILNGIIIDLVLNKFKCSNTRTCIVFPIYNWFYGFLFLKFQIIFASLLPHFVIIFFPLLTSLRNTVQTPNSDVLFYEFAIPYILSLNFNIVYTMKFIIFF
ncbi:hypothetical protein HZS_8137 [Henneguya salminicola]|nr:hypothetical protein HZS_8137 [Henneguya salminicola]